LELPENYNIIFVNKYFEILNSVEISENVIESVNIGDKIKFEGISKGKQLITVITYSSLIIKAELNLIGTSNNIEIVLKNNGILEIR